MSTTPLISVLMPVYNGEKFLREAIESILQQTFTDFEFLIINDGSADRSEDIILSYSDKRIHYIKNDSNLGLIATLNKGVDACIGTYIARMDADDISLPFRFQKQIEFMNTNSDVGVVGSDYVSFSETNERKLTAIHNKNAVKATLLFASCLCHPSVMIRRTILVESGLRFSDDKKHAEDFDLWTRLSKYTHLANVNDVLFRYRDHPMQVSNKHSDIQLVNSNRVRENYLKALGFEFTSEELSTHNLISSNARIRTKEDLLAIEEWLKKLIVQNRDKKIMDEKAFNGVIGKFWLDSCGNTVLGIFAYTLFKGSDLRKQLVVSKQEMFKLLGKCIIRKFK